MTHSSTEGRLLESIRLINGQLPLLDYHQERVDRSRKSLFPKSTGLKLLKILEGHDLPDTGLYKVRIEYGLKCQGVEIQPYTAKPVRSLKLVDASSLRYAKKYADRTAINALYQLKGPCDDILMVQHGFLTDASYANIALFDGSSWYTPASPMLRGTRRASLIQAGTITPTVVRQKDLGHFSEIRLFNSMIPWSEAPQIAITDIMD
ncbi:MAG: aminotransferase class IV [Bacteroidota bacterium]